MMREWRYGVWLLMAGGAGACDRCSWRLEYVEAADASGDSDGADLTPASMGEASMGGTSKGEASTSGTSTDSPGGETAGSGWMTGTSSGSGGTSGTGATGADDIAMSPAFCGDGVIDPGEECDDGNLEDEDGCSNDCWPPRMVFITKKAYDGLLDGVQGADEKCSAAAMFAGLPGHFKAWISGADLRSAPVLRFGSVGFRGWYVRPDGVKVARGWDGLTIEKELKAAISVTEYGVLVSLLETSAWSNTTKKGLPVGDDHCSLWSVTLGGGAIGFYVSKSSGWTDIDVQSCSSEAHLYCFQVG